MVINHNIAALNTLGNLQKNTTATQDSLEKLSTGSKINKAADDASGLAISQKMQAQINGLDQGEQNVSDGTNMIQTAEGSLGNIQDILQKMRTLAVQAQNDTQSTSDKSNLQDQADALAKEITRIANQTTYNTKEVFSNAANDGLFNGTGLKIQIGADDGQSIQVNLASAVVTTYTVTDTANVISTTVAAADVIGTTFTATINSATQTFTITSTAGTSITFKDSYGATGTLAAGFSANGDLLAMSGIGSLTASDYLGGVTADKLGIGNSSGNAIDLTGHDAISTIQTAIDRISKLRSSLGAYQNRLEYASDTDDLSSQNLTQALSGITDTDIAEEMMTYTKNNILVQSAQAMLAQANQLPQGMLTLLKS